MVVQACAAKGRLGSFFAGDMVLLRREQFTPIIVTLDTLCTHNVPLLGHRIEFDRRGSRGSGLLVF